MGCVDMARWFVLISFFFCTILDAKEIGEKLKYTPLQQWDDQQNAYRVNNSFQRVSQNMITDRGHDMGISLTTTSVVLNQVQDDTNYFIAIMPNFFCQYRVLLKTTTDFTLVFHSTGPPGGKLDWIIVR